MAYEVTATRKRPQLFDNLVGQEFVVSTIKNAIEQGRIAHAYLFSGPRGVGKTSSARILARALNCDSGPTPYPCGTCSNCTEITRGNSVDVIEIDGASNTSVNDIRQIKDEVLFPPQTSRYKIYIIDEVHMLSTSAFNALLKTIEEPPAYIVFIFATTEPQKVPATIRSRCQQFHFRLIDLETIKMCLSDAARELEIEADDDALFWIAKESTGSLRDAYTLFDQVVSFSNGHITLEQISDKLGLVGIDQINHVVSNLLGGKHKEALLAVQSLLQNGVSIEQCIKDFTQYFRSLLLMKEGITEESILGVQSDRIPSQIRNAYAKEQLEAGVELFLTLYRDIRYSLNPRFELELAVSRLGSLPHLASTTTLLKRLSQLKDDLLQGKVALSATAPPQPMVETEREKQIPRQAVVQEIQKPEAIPVNLPKQVVPVPVQRPFAKEDIPSLVGKLSNTPILSQVAQSIKKIDNNDNQLTLTFTTKFCKNKAEENQDKFRLLIKEISGYSGKLSFAYIETEEKTQGLKTDPVINKIASVFRGEIS
ncbi:DNA polymerase III, subunit gamma/tau [Sphaerochaeta pleomorpha str. Grapes]|uniref:DNA polymerase III subunit gamma/tau n=1 Tax=Sphaerochaeta pleomorpha (strain ATCC BAA-1885 / DSM 22778 / Grapes) TaxID=158190 RepID=G8QYW1_SPHPG|nr:DNA polymerase III subunit gamma/tau [Sphaerochaeta pleomorpha]AEV29738.1 DNA polymerase III, subunit gamma/tau [Sphaerochaeta pleomorpha str. Grapes]